MLRPKLPLFAALLLAVLLGSCQSLQFQDAGIVETSYDPGVPATKVVVKFQLRDSAGLPVSDLDPADFVVREDGIRTGQEAMPKASREQHPIDVALLIDRSASVYRTGVIREIKAAAERLVQGLQQHPCTVHLYAFARSVTPLDTLNDLPGEAGGGEEHWTSLYHAVHQALDRHPGGIVIVLTDGADNFSHNLGGPTLAELEKRIAEDKRIVHAIGFGAIEDEYDRKGIAGSSALRRLARFGSYLPPERAGPAAASEGGEAGGEAAEASASTASPLDDLVAQVARRIPATYTYEFYSPNLAGEHTVQIEADWDGVRGTSPPLRFAGAGPRSEPEPEPTPEPVKK